MRNVEKHLYRLKRKFFSCQTFVLRLLRIPGLSSNTSPAYSLNKVQCLSDTLGLFLFFFPLTLFFYMKFQLQMRIRQESAEHEEGEKCQKFFLVL